MWKNYERSLCYRIIIIIDWEYKCVVTITYIMLMHVDHLNEYVCDKDIREDFAFFYI